MFLLSWKSKRSRREARDRGGSGLGLDSVGWGVCLLQVALLVAAEFWEQGDLERTVLQQNPIVSGEGRQPAAGCASSSRWTFVASP